VENHLTELWSIMEFASPGRRGPRAEFRRRFAIPIEREGDERAAAALKRATGPFILRRLKTDRSIISDLPEKQEIKVYCNLTAEQASLYRATVDDMLQQVADADETRRRGLVLATMAKLKQVCNHPAQLLKDGSRLPGRSGKRSEEHTSELQSRENLVCRLLLANAQAIRTPRLFPYTTLFRSTAEQASLYRATVDDMLQKIAEADETRRRGLVLATMAKLKQVCNHPAQLLKDGSRLPGRSVT